MNVSTDDHNMTFNISMLQKLSVETVRGQLTNSIAMLICMFINMFASLLSLCILLVSKTNYKSRTFAYLKLFFANELLLCAYDIPYISWHIYNAVTGRPEVMSKRSCLYLISPMYFIIRNSYTLTLLISLDRLLGFIKIAKNQMVVQPITFKPLAPKFVLLILGLLSINILLQVGSFLDTFEEIQIYFCTSKEALGKYGNITMAAVIGLESWATICIYSFQLVVIGMKWAETDTSPGQSNNLNEIRVRDYKRVSRMLAYTSLLYFLIGPFFVTAVTILKQVLPSQLFLTISSWMTLSNAVQGLFYSVSLLLIETYRDDFLKLFWLKHQVTNT